MGSCAQTTALGPIVASSRHPLAEPKLTIQLEPVDSVVITTLIDNVTDVFMPDQGPAQRGAASRGPSRAAAVMEGGSVPDGLVAEHGFSALVTITKGSREHRLLFDAGTSPDGVTDNMRRLEIDPASIEAIVCSHGHFDHTTGIDGLIRARRPGEHAGADPSAFLAAAAASYCPAAIRWSCRRPASGR